MQVSYSGFVNGEDSSVISGTPNVSTLADTNSPVGNSPYMITVSAGTLSAANYSFSFVPGQLTVTQAVLTVKADDQSRGYGAANPALTVSYSGFVNGENTNVLAGGPAVSTTATSNSPAGAYPIVVTAGSLTAANYSFLFQNGQLTVTAAVVVQPGNLTSIQVNGGTVALTFFGSPGTTYHIQRIGTLQDNGVWTDIGSATTDATGQGAFTDNNPLSGQGFYRTSSQ
jgi:hypothetical protein